MLLGLYLQRVPYSLYTFIILITLGSVLSAIHFWTLDFLRELIRAMPYLTLTEFDTLHPCWDGQTSTNSIMRPCTYSWNGIHKVNYKKSLFQIKFKKLITYNAVIRKRVILRLLSTFSFAIVSLTTDYSLLLDLHL